MTSVATTLGLTSGSDDAGSFCLLFRLLSWACPPPSSQTADWNTPLRWHSFTRHPAVTHSDSARPLPLSVVALPSLPRPRWALPFLSQAPRDPSWDLCMPSAGSLLSPQGHVLTPPLPFSPQILLVPTSPLPTLGSLTSPIALRVSPSAILQEAPCTLFTLYLPPINKCDSHKDREGRLFRSLISLICASHVGTWQEVGIYLLNWCLPGGLNMMEACWELY